MTVTLDTGLFGPYGGRYVPEALIAALDELAQMHAAIKDDPVFAAELDHLHKTYSGRPSILTEAIVLQNIVVVRASYLSVKISITPAHIKLITS